jgi:hypothetical protein
MIHIVCYAGGTCGDLITAMIDDKDVVKIKNSIMHHTQRQRLKKPHQFQDDCTKDAYVQWAATVYRSVPSHDLDYHVRRQHEFIAVTVHNTDIALWAATRFQSMHRPRVWKEMQNKSGVSNIQEYAQLLIDFSRLAKQHTDKLIALEKILDGHAVDELERYIDTPINQLLYQDWLCSQ